MGSSILYYGSNFFDKAKAWKQESDSSKEVSLEKNHWLLKDLKLS
jgi:hypothetical protein